MNPTTDRTSTNEGKPQPVVTFGNQGMTGENKMPESKMSKASALERMLIARATGEYPDNDVYEGLRRELLTEPRLKELLPTFVRRCRNLDAFWPYIKGEADTYAERRKIIGEAFTPLMDRLEEENRTPSDEVTSKALETFDMDGVHTIWEKALERRTTDPEGAITVARTLLETVAKRILDETRGTYDDKDDLPKLYARAASELNLAPNQHAEEPIRAILGGAMNLVNGHRDAAQSPVGLARTRWPATGQAFSETCQPCRQHCGSGGELSCRDVPRPTGESEVMVWANWRDGGRYGSHRPPCRCAT